MATTRRAVIDVGTNSVKLLVAEAGNGGVAPVHEASRQTRLGKGFYETHRLQPEPIAHTAAAVAEFAGIARELGAGTIRVIATSAARDAMNPTDLTQAIERASGLRTEIITGAQEAEWAYRGVATDAALAGHSLLLLDVGGGSTEFILGQGGRMAFAHSFPLGTVRLMEKLPQSDPPAPEELQGCRAWLQTFLRETVRPELAPALERTNHGTFLVGTGGTTSILGRMEHKLDHYDRDRIERTVLSLERVRAQSDRLWGLPLAARQTIPGLPANRADVILTGSLIYEAVMEEFGFNELRISTRGLRFAAVMG